MRLAEIRRYPVKSLRGHGLGEAMIERLGIAGDRRWMIVDETGRFLTQRQIPKLAQIDVEATPDGVILRHDRHGALRIAIPGEKADLETVVVWRDSLKARSAPSASEYLSDFLGRPARLVYLADVSARPVNPVYGRGDDRVSFADGFPLLVTSTASLDDLNWRLEAPVPMDRFRANLVVAGAPAWAEDGWRRIRVGALMLRLVKPCSRCAVPTLDPMTGERPAGNEPIDTLARFRRGADGGIMFGQNAVPDDFGWIAVGDEVEVIEVGPSNI
jgi:uncharacterized protein YcbX